MASTLPPDRPPGPISSTGADAANTPETDNGADVQPQTPKGSPSFQSSGLSERTVEQSENIHPQMKSGEELAAQSKEKLQELLSDSTLSNSYRRHAESKQIDSVKGLLKDVSGAIDWYSGNAAENFRSIVSAMRESNPKLEKLNVVMNIPPYGEVHLVPPGDDLEHCERDLQQILDIAYQMADGLSTKIGAEISTYGDEGVITEGEKSFRSIIEHLDPDSRQDAFNQFRAFQNPPVTLDVSWSDLSNNSAWRLPDLSKYSHPLMAEAGRLNLKSEEIPEDVEEEAIDKRFKSSNEKMRKAGEHLEKSGLDVSSQYVEGMGDAIEQINNEEQHIPDMLMFNSDEGLQSPKHQDNRDPSSTRLRHRAPPTKKRGPESSEEMDLRESLSRPGKKPRAGDEEYGRTFDHSRLRSEDEDDDVFDDNLSYKHNPSGRLSRSSGDNDTPNSPVFRPLPPPGGSDGQRFRYPSDMEENLTRVLHARQQSAAYKTPFPYTDRRSPLAREHRVKSSDVRVRSESSVSSEDDWVHQRKSEGRRDPSNGLLNHKDTEDESSLFESSNPGGSVRSSGSSRASQGDRYLESHRRQSTDLRQMDTDQQQWFEHKEAWRFLSSEEQVSLHQQTDGKVVPPRDCR